MTSSGPQLIRYPGAPRKLPTLLIAWQNAHSLHTYNTAKLSGSLAKHTQPSPKSFPTLGPESSRAPSPPERESSRLVQSIVLARTSLPGLCTSSPLGEARTLLPLRAHRSSLEAGPYFQHRAPCTRSPFFDLSAPRGRFSQDDGVECKRHPRAQRGWL